MDKLNMKLDALKKILAGGEEQACSNGFVEADMEGIIQEVKAERNG